MSIYYFLLSLFWKNRRKGYVRTRQSLLTQREWGYGGGYVMLSIREDVFIYSRRFLFLFIWGELTSTPSQSTHFRTLNERGRQISLD